MNGKPALVGTVRKHGKRELIKTEKGWECLHRRGNPLFTIKNKRSRLYIKISENPWKWIPYANYLWENATGKKVPKGMLIHHRDRNPLNNELSNLQGPMTPSEHSKLHACRACNTPKANQNKRKPKGVPRTEEHNRKIGEAHKGIKLTDEWRSHISKSKMGIKNPNYPKNVKRPRAIKFSVS